MISKQKRLKSLPLKNPPFECNDGLCLLIDSPIRLLVGGWSCKFDFYCLDVFAVLLLLDFFSQLVAFVDVVEGDFFENHITHGGCDHLTTKWDVFGDLFCCDATTKALDGFFDDTTGRH